MSSVSDILDMNQDESQDLDSVLNSSPALKDYHAGVKSHRDALNAAIGSVLYGGTQPSTVAAAPPAADPSARRFVGQNGSVYTAPYTPRPGVIDAHAPLAEPVSNRSSDLDWARNFGVVTNIPAGVTDPNDRMAYANGGRPSSAIAAIDSVAKALPVNNGVPAQLQRKPFIGSPGGTNVADQYAAGGHYSSYNRGSDPSLNQNFVNNLAASGVGLTPPTVAPLSLASTAPAPILLPPKKRDDFPTPPY